MGEKPNWNATEPIVFDPAIRDLLMETGPSLEDLDQPAERSVVESVDAKATTLDELIDALESMRDVVGGDARVKDFETGTSIHVFASKYNDGSSVVRL